MLHNKKEIFFEDFAGYKPDKQKEEEANSFAVKYLLPEKAIDELSSHFTETDIVDLAEKYKTHPAIIVGRLQHLRIKPFSFGNKLKEKIGLENEFTRSSDKIEQLSRIMKTGNVVKY